MPNRTRASLDSPYRPQPATVAMSIEILTRRYSRLREELSLAYGSLPWRTEWIDVLANRLVATEKAIAALQSAGERRPHGEPGRGAGHTT